MILQTTIPNDESEAKPRQANKPACRRSQRVAFSEEKAFSRFESEARLSPAADAQLHTKGPLST